MLGVVYEVVVASAVPPLATLNHAIVALVGGVAVNKNVPAPHLDADVPAGAAGAVVTVAVTATLVADTHPVVKFLVCA